jgi:hypothetical protein
MARRRNPISRSPKKRGVGLVYSYRSAIMGSTRMAVRDGATHAASPTAKITVATAANVHGSVAETPQIWLARKRVSAALANRPSAIPATISAAPLRSTRRKMGTCPCALEVGVYFLEVGEIGAIRGQWEIRRNLHEPAVRRLAHLNWFRCQPCALHGQGARQP